MLKGHNRYAYEPIVGRKSYEWPNGARLAIFTALNVEAFPFGEGLGVDLAPGQPQPDVVNYSWRDYGNRVGFWRLMELLDEFKIPATVVMNTAIFDECPPIAASVLKRGDEIVGHGHTNAAERPGTMPEADERRLIGEVVDVIRNNAGSAPAGWLGPWVSESHVTLDLLQEAGFSYHLDWLLDDQPVWMKTRRGRILAIPCPRPTGDLALMHRSHFTPQQCADILIDQIDEMLQQSRSAALVFGLSFHPYLVGHAFRLKHLRRVYEHIASHAGQIWLCRTGEIAKHIQALPPGVVPGSA
jgi:allantoinase